MSTYNAAVIDMLITTQVATVTLVAGNDLFRSFQLTLKDVPLGDNRPRAQIRYARSQVCLV